MIVSGKIAEMFKHRGFINIDYLVENKLERNPSKILNIINRDWRKWVKPLCMLDGGDPLDPNFGIESYGASSLNLYGDQIAGNRLDTPVDMGTLNSISAYVGRDNPSGGGSSGIKGVVTLRSDLSIVIGGVGSETVIPSYNTPAWRTSIFSPALSLAPSSSNYIFGIINQISRSDLFYDGLQTNFSCDDETNNYANPQNWVSAVLMNYKLSIYCTYTAGAPPPPKPKGTIAIHAKLAGII